VVATKIQDISNVLGDCPQQFGKIEGLRGCVIIAKEPLLVGVFILN
jgi:hypothetical protein